MRRILAIVLIGLGGFLVVAGLVARQWAPGQVERTPLDTDNTTYLSGQARVAGSDLRLAPAVPVLGWSTNKIDADASTDDLAAWVTSLCLVRDQGDPTGCVDADDPQGRLITAESDVFATDRHTGLSVDDRSVLPADAEHEEGLQNKWPFGAQPETYPVWNGVLGHAVDAAYVDTKTVDGLSTLHYRATANGTGVDVIGDVKGTYANTTDYYVEPRTGAIIDQVIHEERAAAGVGKILDLDLAFTDDQVRTNVDDARTNLDTLGLMEDTVPVVGLAAGIPLALVGVVLLVLGRRRSTPADPAAVRTPETAGA